MTTINTVDAARVEPLLSGLRLPGIKLMLVKARRTIRQRGLAGGSLPRSAGRTREGRPWPPRIERHLAEARLPAGKTLATSTSSRTNCLKSSDDGIGVRRRVAGEGCQHLALRAFGPPGRRQNPPVGSAQACLVENGWRVMFARTADLVQRLRRSA